MQYAVFNKEGSQREKTLSPAPLAAAKALVCRRRCGGEQWVTLGFR